MTDYNPDTLPTSDDPGGPCPRCGRVSSFEVNTVGSLKGSLLPGAHTVYERAFILTCRGCHEGTILVEGRRNTTSGFKPLVWWPTPGAGQRNESIPETVWEAYEEAIRCLGIKVPNAAAAMLRSTVAQVVQDKGSDAAKGKRSLNEALKQMVKDGSLHPLIEEWAGHIKDLGNAGAHPEIFGEVTQEEAEELQRLVQQLLQLLYVVPAGITKARESRLNPTAAPSEPNPGRI